VYKVVLSRSSQYYTISIEVPSIVLTLLSFGVFWLDCSQCGERLGFGITILLAVMVNTIVVQEVLPVCGETLWIEMFLLLNLVFTVVALFESLVVVHVAFSKLDTVDEAAAEVLLLCDSS